MNKDTLRALENRCGSVCELTGISEDLTPFLVAPKTDETTENMVMIATSHLSQVKEETPIKPEDWRGLNESIWSEFPAVQVMAYRLLHRLKEEAWARDILEMVFLDEETLLWAQSDLPDANAQPHLDSNGHPLAAGDSVVLIKDLDVKGANFTAKRGTPVRNITLVHDNHEHIEGKVNGQRIVILTKFVKKT